MVRSHRLALIALVASYPVLAAVGLVPPLLIKAAIERCFLPRRAEGLGTLVMVFSAVAAVELVGAYVQTRLTERIAHGAARSLRVAAFEAMSRLDPVAVQRTPSGTMVSRIVSDVDAVTAMFSNGILGFLGDVITVSFIVVAMLAVDVVAAGCALAVLPVIGVVLAIILSRLRAWNREVHHEDARLAAALADAVGGASLIRIFDRKQRTLADVDLIAAASIQSRDRATRSQVLALALVESTSILAIAAMLFAVFALTVDATRLAAFVTIIEFLRRLFVPVGGLAGRWAALQAGLAAWERVHGLLVEAPMRRESAPQKPGAFREIRFDEVTFSYAPGAPVLDRVSFTLRRGETLAIVGPTGGGKSTIVKLLSAFHHPERGRISVDGVDLADIDPDHLRRRLAVVFQDVAMFSGTIAENIGLGLNLADPDVKRRLEVAATRARAMDVIERRPEGWAAEVGERGCRLSSGERQLLAIARAFARDPEILIFDEATSAVDPDTEAKIQAALANLLANRTALVIAHRRSTIERADRVLVVSDATIRPE